MAMLIDLFGRDEIQGTKCSDIIFALGGDDTVNSGDGCDIVFAGCGNDTVLAGEGSDLVLGGAGSDRLNGDAGCDLLLGGSENDTIQGGTGNDMICGGTGNDILNGGAGNDTYLFTLGSGQDVVRDYGEAADINTIIFGRGINPEDLRFVRENGDLAIYIKDTTDKLSISGYYEINYNLYNKISSIQFANGTVWDAKTIASQPLTGTEGDDTLVGSEYEDILNGLGGNDNIKAYGGNDIIYGGEGNDILYGLIGSDVIDGGGGDDKLYGGAGDDVYLFSAGGGQDTVYEYDTTPGNSDKVQIDTSMMNVICTKEGYDLKLRICGTEDVLTVNRYYVNSYYKVEEFGFAGGTTFAGAQIEQLVQAMASFASQNGTSWSQIIQGTPEEERQMLDKFWAHQNF